MRIIKGDTPSAPCYNSPAESDYRPPAHNWHSLMMSPLPDHVEMIIEGCNACGAMRETKRVR